MFLGYKNSGKRLRIKIELPDGTIAQDNSPDDPPSVTPLSKEELEEREERNRSPDYESEEDFDPFEHDGGEAIDDVLSYAKDRGHNGSEPIDNMFRIGSQAFEYIQAATGLDFVAVFRRWSSIPPIFYPNHVLQSMRATPHLSTASLIDDAIKAYVFGARAAAIAMCRAALEDVLKRDYGQGKWNEEKLGKIVVLASSKYQRLVDRRRLQYLVRTTNTILHSYSSTRKDDAKEDQVVRDYLIMVKHLIQNAPGRL